MNNSPIVFLDSGLGGLPYLDWIQKRLTSENYIYVADTAHFPYGEKSTVEVKDIVLSLMEEIKIRFNPKIAVIACNTASVIALKDLRKEFSIPFVGVVPAVKTAAEHSKKRIIGVLATERTVQDTYLENLIKKYASDCKIVRVSAGNIVRFVEEKFLSSDEMESAAIIEPAMNTFKNAGTDAIVLGCTHFIYLSELLMKYTDNGTEVIDSREGVGNQIMRVLKNKNLFSKMKNEGNAEIYITGERKDIKGRSSKDYEKIYNDFSKKLGFTYRGNMLREETT